MNLPLTLASGKKRSENNIGVEFPWNQAVPNRSQDQIQISPEAAVFQIRDVQGEFVGLQTITVIGLRIGLVAQEFFFVAIDEAGEIGYARAGVQYRLPER